MGDNRFQKAIFCSELEEGTRSRGGQQKRYKDTLKANLKHCDIATPELEELALDRSDWRRSHCKTSIQQFEAGRVWTLETNDNTNLLHMDQPCGNSRRQGFILVRCQLPLRCLRTFLCVEDRAMHVVALTYQHEFTVIRDPSCRRLSPPMICGCQLSSAYKTKKIKI